MNEIIMENIISVAATLMMTLIGVMGAWLTAKAARREELSSVRSALEEVSNAAQTTVLELQQTLVEGWKAAHADGKLTEEEKARLGRLLLGETKKKLSMPTVRLLNAACVDINAVIVGAGEALIARMKQA